MPSGSRIRIFIIVSGDMYTSLPGKETITAQKLMEELAKSYSVYYAKAIMSRKPGKKRKSSEVCMRTIGKSCPEWEFIFCRMSMFI